MTDSPTVPIPDTRTPDTVTSLIRTWVPIAVGAVVAWAAESTHTVLPAGASAATGTLVAALLAGAYYALARVLEQVRGESTLARFGRTAGTVMFAGRSKPVYP